MRQSPAASADIAASAKEQLALIWQQISGDGSLVPIAPSFPQCLFSPPHRGYTTVTIWVAFTTITAATQVKEHLIQQRWADIPISSPQFATAVPAQLHDGDHAIYAVKVLSPQFTAVNVSETVQIVNSVSDQLGGIRLLWLGALSHTGMITNRFSDSMGQLQDIAPPAWDLHPSPGLVGLAISGISILAHSATSPGAQITNSAGEVINLQFKRVPNRAVLVTQPQPQTVIRPFAPTTPAAPSASPVVNPAMQRQPVSVTAAQQPPATAPVMTPSARPVRPARPPATTTLQSQPIQQPVRPVRTPLQIIHPPQTTIYNSQPFPIGTWVSRPVATSPKREYGFVLAHILDRPRGAPSHTSPVTFMRVIWAASQYLDVYARDWAGYADAQSDKRLSQSIKDHVRRKITTAFDTPRSELGKYVHALTAHHWFQLGIPKPICPPDPVTTNIPASAVVTTPTPMNIDSTTGVRRGRDPSTSPTTQPVRKMVRISTSPQIQLHSNPFYLLQHSAEASQLPATIPDGDGDYGDDWDADADSDAADQYDNAAALCAYEGGPRPTTCSSQRAATYRLL